MYDGRGDKAFLLTSDTGDAGTSPHVARRFFQWYSMTNIAIYIIKEPICGKPVIELFLLLFVVINHLQQNTLYPQRWQILRRRFLVLSRYYVMLILTTTYWIPSLYYRHVNQSEVSKNCCRRSATFGVKGILLPLVDCRW